MYHSQAPTAQGCHVRRRAVIVAGMHRSGTSALTRVLSHCGLGMPRTLVPPDGGNIAGHWESEPVRRFNDRLLARVGLDWISWRRGAADLANESDYSDLVGDGARIILNEFGAIGDIVLKDPRICRLLPFWLDVLRELEIEPVIVLAVRSPLQVARSLKRRNALLTSYSFRTWLRFMLEAERASRNVPRLVISFDQLLHDWRSVAMALDRCVGGGMLDCTTEADRAVSAFLSTDLRHFAYDDDERSTPDCVTNVHGVFSRWQQRPEAAEDYIQLDEVHRALDEAPSMLIRFSMAGWTSKWLARQRQRLAQWLGQRLGSFDVAYKSAGIS
jgi:hypothetical protein